MSAYTQVHRLQVATELHRFIEERVLPGTGFLIAYDDPVGVARELAAFCG